MKLKDFMKYVLEEFNNSLEVGITFDLGIDNDMEINSESKNRIKFSIKNK